MQDTFDFDFFFFEERNQSLEEREKKVQIESRYHDDLHFDIVVSLNFLI